MQRRLAVVVAAAALAVAGSAAASPANGPLRTVEIPAPVGDQAQTAPVLYLNRCVGGCTVKVGATNDARARTSTIPNGTVGQEFTLSEFAHGDEQWDLFMQCMREVYSPYAVMVTDVPPAGGVAYNEGIVAGIDNEINYNAGGVAPIANDCNPYSFVISFTFANQYGPNSYNTLCYVAAQETAHAFGLDHSFEYADGRSACTDPMSYRTDCGGQRFFRNEAATCGENAPRDCRCGGTQNTHLYLTSILGPSTPLTAAPTVTVTQPVAGAQITNATPIILTAYAQRGVHTIEVFLNGYKWAERKGAAFGQQGQPESTYSIPLPQNVPDGVIDVEIKVKDDIGATTAAPTITVTKGAPCANADSCAAGQLCEDGKCFWEPAAGEIGETCTFPQFCLSGICGGTATEQICTQNCIVGVGDSCPMGFECLQTGPGSGLCWFQGGEETGCCSTSNDAAAGSLLLGFGVLILVAVPRRRRRR